MYKLLFIVLFLPLMAQAQVDKAAWLQADTVKFRYYNADAKTYYQIQNDSQHIYLKIKISDKSTQMKICNAGMVFYLKSRDYKSKIHYPVYKGEATNKNQPGYSHFKNKLTADNVYYRLENFARTNGLYSKDKLGRIELHHYWGKQNDLYINIKIPFTELFKIGRSKAEMLKKPIELVLEQKPLRGAASTVNKSNDALVTGTYGTVETKSGYVSNKKSKSPLFKTIKFKQEFVLLAKPND